MIFLFTDVVHFGVLPSHFDCPVLAVDDLTSPPSLFSSTHREKAVTYLAPPTARTGGFAVLALGLAFGLFVHHGWFGRQSHLGERCEGGKARKED